MFFTILFGLALAQPAKGNSMKPCPGKKPNCVSTNHKSSEDYYIAPIKLANADEIEQAWKILQELPSEFRMQWKEKTDTRLVGIARTPLMRFKDDVIFQKNRELSLIEMRSESRFGYSDWGANRERLEKVRAHIKSKLNKK